jgi:hypothetical protein
MIIITNLSSSQTLLPITSLYNCALLHLYSMGHNGITKHGPIQKKIESCDTVRQSKEGF